MNDAHAEQPQPAERSAFTGAGEGEAWLAERFEGQRGRLRAVAYRMLGSLSEAEDAVQEAWLRLSRSDADAIDNLGGWLTTVVGRVCLDMLRSRAARREEPLESAETSVPRLPDPVVSLSPVGGAPERLDPEQEVLLADSVGLALLVVLDTLSPAERLAFVLRDMFAVPFEEIAPLVGRSPAAARQLASRARRRVQGSAAAGARETDLARQRAVVDAFQAAARKGDFDALVALLDPEVVLRADRGAVPAGASIEVRGAAAVAGQAGLFARSAAEGLASHPALVNGAAGIVSTLNGRPFSVLGFTIVDDRIVEIDILADPARLARLELELTD